MASLSGIIIVSNQRRVTTVVGMGGNMVEALQNFDSETAKLIEIDKDSRAIFPQYFTTKTGVDGKDIVLITQQWDYTQRIES